MSQAYLQRPDDQKRGLRRVVGFSLPCLFALLHTDG